MQPSPLERLMNTELFEKYIIPYLMMPIPEAKMHDISELAKAGWFSGDDHNGMKAPLPGLDILKLAYLNSKFGTKIALVFPPSAMSKLHTYH
jgi:hypothetical protein